MAPWASHVILVVVAAAVLIKTAEGKKDQMLYCSACRALADELNYSVSQVDPKKTIHVGSFRLNPDGSLEDKKVPLARSETHLTELLENVCDSMNDYALYIDPDTKEKSYKRFAPREGEGGNFPDFKHFQFDGPDGSESLKFACENIVEEYEDNIISLFVQGVGDVLDMLCGKISGHCKGSLSPHSEL
ncbi:protein canopy-1 isoform X2 [Scleropages formosus]|uniref:Canopy FGF signaling regulator 1 n=2 Tax=Scleropages formosus TaxID=113540 RepID=A0A8C9R0L4_SCLFO|nr:protein canopy homolog 1 isoform X2 [Scleropages formosus]